MSENGNGGGRVQQLLQVLLLAFVAGSGWLARDSMTALRSDVAQLRAEVATVRAELLERQDAVLVGDAGRAWLVATDARVAALELFRAEHERAASPRARREIR